MTMTMLQLRMPLLQLHPLLPLHPLLRLHLLRSFTLSSTARKNNKKRPQGTYESMSRDLEFIEQYKPGGYCPVSIGDSIRDRRYSILQKLGSGSFSTVWLAEDHHGSRLVALKFLRADTPPNSTEIAILQHLRAAEHPFVMPLLDEFTVDSANGSHHCLVSEALGPSLMAVRAGLSHNRLPTRMACDVVAQCVRGLAHVHSCGVAHGDFHTGNILLAIPGLENWTAAEVSERFGTPKQEPIVRTDGAPGEPAAPPYAVFPPDIRAVLPFCDTKVTLVDFGNAYRGTRPSTMKTAYGVAAPEILFCDPAALGMPADTWALACTLYEILGDHRLLESSTYSRDEFIVEMVRTLGRLPDVWWPAWKARAEYCEDDGTLKPTPGNISGEPRRVCIKERVAGLVRRTNKEVDTSLDEDERAVDMPLDEQEKMVVERMLEAMVKYEPADRATVAEVVGMLPPNW